MSNHKLMIEKPAVDDQGMLYAVIAPGTELEPHKWAWTPSIEMATKMDRWPDGLLPEGKIRAVVYLKRKEV